MHLVQILLPTADNDGQPFPSDWFRDLRQDLTDRFGGVTVYAQAPAEGFWQGGEDAVPERGVGSGWGGHRGNAGRVWLLTPTWTGETPDDRRRDEPAGLCGEDP